MALAYHPNEIISGTVVSVDTSAYTISVQPSDDGAPIDGVTLNTVTGSDNGVVIFPAAGSDVIIGRVDGPGEWTLIKTGEITKASVKIGNITCVADNTKVTVTNNNVILEISDSAFKLNTASESLFQLLQDLITYITALTVPTSTGPSGVPANVADFTALLSRLNNLLVH